MAQDDQNNQTGFDTGLDIESEAQLKKPTMYRVIMHNDHYTTMDFVIQVLISIFHKSMAEATVLMLQVHEEGAAAVGVYTYDIALTKIEQVHQLAKQNEYPLKCSYEEA